MSHNPLSPHFIVIVPGYMGSRLREKSTQKLVWLDIASLVKNPLKIEKAVDAFLEKLTYPNDDIEPAGLMDQLLIVPPFVKQEHYGRLMDELIKWGYQIDPAEPNPTSLAAYTFSYDWRQDNRISARQLGEAIERWQKLHPDAKAWIVSHSNGGIVSRWYIQQEGGANYVDRLFLMGSPWDGAPTALKILLDGLDVLGLIKLNRYDLGKRLGKVVRSFPSFYQLFPVDNPFLRNESNRRIDLFEDPSWLECDEEKRLLLDAQEFNHQIAKHPHVDTICFFGNRKITTTAAMTRINDQGKFVDVQWIETEWGDGTVPIWSACHPWFKDQREVCWKQYPVSHGDIYIDGGVLAFLHQEAFGVPMEEHRGMLTRSNLNILFDTDKDFYTPEEEMEVWVDLKDPGSEEPVTDISISAWIAGRQSLPGSEDITTTFYRDHPKRLEESQEIPGHFSARIKSPSLEGYYRVIAEIHPPENPVIHMEEPVIVEEI